MIKTKIWDKKESINGVSAEEVLQDNFYKSDDVILVYDDITGRVSEMQLCGIMHSLLNLQEKKTSKEIAELYLEYKLNQDKQVKKKEQEKIENKNKQEILNVELMKQNAQLQIELQKQQEFNTNVMLKLAALEVKNK